MGARLRRKAREDATPLAGRQLGHDELALEVAQLARLQRAAQHLTIVQRAAAQPNAEEVVVAHERHNVLGNIGQQHSHAIARLEVPHGIPNLRNDARDLEPHYEMMGRAVRLRVEISLALRKVGAAHAAVRDLNEHVGVADRHVGLSRACEMRFGGLPAWGPVLPNNSRTLYGMLRQ